MCRMRQKSSAGGLPCVSHPLGSSRQKAKGASTVGLKPRGFKEEVTWEHGGFQVSAELVCMFCEVWRGW